MQGTGGRGGGYFWPSVVACGGEGHLMVLSQTTMHFQYSPARFLPAANLSSLTGVRLIFRTHLS